MRNLRLKHFLFANLLAVAAAGANAEVGVSVTIGQPGFYGRLDIGDYPAPLLIYPQPLVIGRVRPGVAYAPIYLHVPPGHSRDWARHCRRYQACGRPVYFVRENWYNDVYVPRYRESRHRPGYRHDERRRLDRYGPGDGPYRRRDGRYSAPGYPPGPPRGRMPLDGADFPPGPRPGHAPGYGPGFPPGRLPGRP